MSGGIPEPPSREGPAEVEDFLEGVFEAADRGILEDLLGCSAIPVSRHCRYRCTW